MTEIYFPHTVDSTIVEAWRACPQRCFRTYFQHWKPKGKNVHLHAGGAYAKGLEAARRAYYEHGESSDTSIGLGLEALIKAYGDFSCPPESAKSLDRTAGALEFYFSQYPLERDSAIPITLPGGKRGIEFSFAEPLDFRHPVTGNPILYTGRSDMIVNYAAAVYVEDDKTASQLGPSWSRQWDMRPQFMGYVWAARKAGIEATGALVRGVSILKTKYDTQQAAPHFARFELDRWEEELYRTLWEMKAAWEDLSDKSFKYNLGNSCQEYGGCAYVPVCKSPNPEVWLPMYFEPRVWDPLAREEKSVEQYEAQFAASA